METLIFSRRLKTKGNIVLKAVHLCAEGSYRLPEKCVSNLRVKAAKNYYKLLLFFMFPKPHHLTYFFVMKPKMMHLVVG